MRILSALRDFRSRQLFSAKRDAENHRSARVDIRGLAGCKLKNPQAETSTVADNNDDASLRIRNSEFEFADLNLTHQKLHFWCLGSLSDFSATNVAPGG